MTWRTLQQFDMHGLIPDLPADTLPPAALTTATNACSTDGGVSKFSGYARIYDPPSVAPYYLLPGKQGDLPWWLYAGLTKIYAISEATHSNATRQTLSADVNYTATEENVWTGAWLQNIAILNNGSDAPQSWAGPTNRCQNLANWPASIVCRSMRAYKNFLVALDVTKSSIRYPHLVKWSHPAVQGSVPSSWDETDATKDAGETSLSDTPGYLIDSLTLRDTHMVYKTDATYAMQFLDDSPLIFRFSKLFNHGLMSRNCAVEFNGMHALLTQNDVVVHDGQTIKTIASRRVRSAIFNSINSNYFQRCHVAHDPLRREIWFCIPVSASIPEIAWVWNYRTDTWGKVELPGVASMAEGSVSATADTWDSDSGTWDSDSSTWDLQPTIDRQFIAASPVNARIYQFNVSGQADGVNLPTTLERTGLAFGDPVGAVLLRRARVNISATSGTEVLLQFGSQAKMTDAVNWGSQMSYTIGSEREIYPRVRGRYLAWRITSTTANAWQLSELSLDVVPAGRY